MFRQPAGYANGNTLDREGRLVTCEHGNRRVTRTEHDGSITVLADQFEGKRFNSPNDVVVRSDGSIWFTDPPTASTATTRATAPRARSAAATSTASTRPTDRCTIVADDFVRPNGLAFSLDESILYIADTRANHIRVFDVGE